MVGLRYYWLYCLGKICNVFSLIVSIGVENAVLVLDCTKSFASVTCFSQQGQTVRMNNFFCVNAFLCCSSISSPMPAIYACRAIRLLHTLRLSDCPTSFTVLILMLQLLRCLTQVCCRPFEILELLLITSCLIQVSVLPMRSQISTLLPVMHDLLSIVYFFNYSEFIF